MLSAKHCIKFCQALSLSRSRCSHGCVINATLILGRGIISFFITVVVAVWKRGIDDVTCVLSQIWRGRLDLGKQQDCRGKEIEEM